MYTLMGRDHHERIQQIGDNVGFDSEVILDAVKLFEDVFESDLTTPYKRVYPAVLLLAADRNKSPQSVDVVVPECENNRDEIVKTKKKIKDTLELDLPPTDPEDVLPTVCEELELSSEVFPQAKEYIQMAKEEQHVSGKNPYAVAAAAIYVASQISGNRLSQSVIRDASEVSEVTIRNRQKEVLDAAATQLTRQVYENVDETDCSKIQNLFRWSLSHDQLKSKTTRSILAGACKYIIEENTSRKNISEVYNVPESTVDTNVTILSTISDQIPDLEEPIAFPGLDDENNDSGARTQTNPEAVSSSIQTDLTTYETVTEQRRLDSSFRETMLERYEYQCLLTDIDDPRLLDVAHIVPRSEREDIAGDPENVIILSKTLHAAFDRGLFTITRNKRILAYPQLSTESSYIQKEIVDRSGEKVNFPEIVTVSIDHLEERNENLSWFDPNNLDRY